MWVRGGVVGVGMYRVCVLEDVQLFVGGVCAVGGICVCVFFGAYWSLVGALVAASGLRMCVCVFGTYWVHHSLVGALGSAGGVGVWLCSDRWVGCGRRWCGSRRLPIRRQADLVGMGESVAGWCWTHLALL